MSEMALLKLEDVVVDYGSIHALKKLNMEVDSGEIITLIGANGAGKSTTMKAIMGLTAIWIPHWSVDGGQMTAVHSNLTIPG